MAILSPRKWLPFCRPERRSAPTGNVIIEWFHAQRDGYYTFAITETRESYPDDRKQRIVCHICHQKHRYLARTQGYLMQKQAIIRQHLEKQKSSATHWGWINGL